MVYAYVTVDNAFYRSSSDISVDSDEDYISDIDEHITDLKNRSKITHLIDMWLKPKSHYCLQLEKVPIILYARICI